MNKYEYRIPLFGPYYLNSSNKIHDNTEECHYLDTVRDGVTLEVVEAVWARPGPGVLLLAS